ncbi:MAG TPA: N-acetylmuramoyl-L-alanine amidase-like domain-containing protein, partial [Dissulfurispiraceae bacterium]|nr:N-acetylmuramoyl-L-alanine amidase-like domain-containing protein [Dissulfurispiraceae bacterium]
RDIEYIPSNAMADKLVDNLETGDYIGIYSATPGLDVSHVGIFIKTGGEAYLRHASSAKQQRKVIDQDFKSYIKTKQGVIVLRPK